METLTLTSTRLDKPSLKHKLRNLRHCFGSATLFGCCLWLLTCYIFTGKPLEYNWFSLILIGLSTTFLCLNIFFLKSPPQNHAMVAEDGRIVIDIKRGNYVLWRWEYADLLRKGKLIGYTPTFQTIETKVGGLRYTIDIWTNQSLEESLALEKILSSLKEARVSTAQELVLCHLYDILDEHKTVITSLTNPLRTEQQEVFRALLARHLKPLLVGTGILVATQHAKFDWA